MSTEYIYFTAEQKETARQTDLVSLLQSQGERLKRSGKEYVWRDGSEKVTVRGNLWFHQYERIGGDAVDFVRRFYNMDFPQAVNFLLGNNGGALPQAEPVKREPPKPFTLPPKNDNMRRVYAYLLIAKTQNWRRSGHDEAFNALYRKYHDRYFPLLELPPETETKPQIAHV